MAYFINKNFEEIKKGIILVGKDKILRKNLEISKVFRNFFSNITNE